MFGYWLVNLVSGGRHLMAVMRKRITCTCGCRGWCSYRPVYEYLRWTIDCLARGRFPSNRHDGQEWREEDSDRRLLAGKEIRLPAAVLYVKGDWGEFSGSMGFPPWSSATRPCMFCSAAKDDMYNMANLSPVSFPYRENADDEHAAAAARCEIKVMITQELHKAILPLLRYDKRRLGGHGRTLLRDVPVAGLQANDRLEPSAALADVGRYENLADFPVELTFWRCSWESLVQHRNPMWCDRLALSPARSLAVDSLHTYNLGVVQAFCKVAVWKVLGGSQWSGAPSSAEDKAAVAVLCLRSDLHQFYGRHKKERPEEQLTQLNDLTAKMMGTRASPLTRMSGAESFGFAVYLTDTLRRFGGLIGPDAPVLVEAGENLVRIQRLSRGCAGKVPLAVQQDSWGAQPQCAHTQTTRPPTRYGFVRT